MAFDDDNDFGFSMIDPVNLGRIKKDNMDAMAFAQSAKDNLNQVYDMVMPLLKNLALNPEKDIHWPNRDVKLKQMIDKINTICGKKSVS